MDLCIRESNLKQHKGNGMYVDRIEWRWGHMIFWEDYRVSGETLIKSDEGGKEV